MRRHGTVMVWLMGGVAMFGCAGGDEIAPTGTSGGEPPTLAIAQPEDPDINPEDTYVSFDASVSTDASTTLTTPVYDPETGQQSTELTLAPAVDNQFSVESGYDVNSVLRVHVRGTWSTTADSFASTVPDAYNVSLINGQVQQLTSGGTLLSASSLPADTAPPATSILAPEGNLLLYGSITDGVLVDSLRAATSAITSVQNARQGIHPQWLVSGNLAAFTATSSEENGAFKGNTTTKRAYKKDGKYWVLDEVIVEQETSDGKVKGKRTHRLKLRNVVYQINAQRDSLRAARLAAAPAAPPQLFAKPPKVRPDLYSCEYYGTCETETSSPKPPPGRNVAFQHGFASAPGVWNRMRNWLRPSYRFGTEIAPDLSEYQRAETQTNELISQLTATGKLGYLVVGHSMGGLVARRVAQSRPTLVTGVLTVGTPHLGAELARNSRQALSEALTASLSSLAGCSGPSHPIDLIGCTIADRISFYAIDKLIEFGVDAAAPGVQDLQPESVNPYLVGLNSVSETFTRVGIWVYVPKGGIVVRLMGDRFCVPESTSCGGREWADWWNDVRGYLRFCQVYAALRGDYGLFSLCTRVRGGMDEVDGYWNQLTAPRDRYTDGIVQGSSQVYPRATYNWELRDGDSHFGQTQSDRVRGRIINAFDINFRVPKP